MPHPDRTLDLAGNFVVCAGTITLDRARRRALLVHYKRKAEHLPPKGHADRGEALPAAALRETREETGYSCRLLPHTLPTHATRPTDTAAGAVEDAEEGHGKHVEPLALQQRMVRGVRKLVFWFLAEGDAAEEPGPRPPEDEAMFEPVWVPYAELPETLKFADDKRIVEQALNAVGETMWPRAEDPFDRVSGHA